MIIPPLNHDQIISVFNADLNDNGFECRLSADALGLVACLYAYSHLCFDTARVGDDLAQTCARQYHLLREWALSHPQAGLILAVID